MGELRQHGNHVCSEQMRKFGFSQKETRQECTHDNNRVSLYFFFLIYISGAKFEGHCSNISGDILDSVFHCLSGTVYDIITCLICIIQKMKKDIPKRKMLFLFMLKSF